MAGSLADRRYEGGSFAALTVAAVALKGIAVLVFGGAVFAGTYLVTRGGEGIGWGLASVVGGSLAAVFTYAAASTIDVLLAIEAHLRKLAAR